MNFDGESKKEYIKPELVSFGDVRDVTLSASNIASDSFYGEDNPFIM